MYEHRQPFLFHKKAPKDFTLGAVIGCPKISKFKTHKYKNVRKFVRICFNLLILSADCGVQRTRTAHLDTASVAL